MIGVILI